MSASPCLHEVRFLRPAPAGDVAVLDFDQRASRAHTGMRLERPFVLRLDHPGGGFERLLDIAVLLFNLCLAHRRFADVIVERGLLRERRDTLRPFDLQLFGSLDGVPFRVSNDAEEALIPDYLGVGIP